MFIDTWIVITAPPVIGALGFFIGVRFMAGKVADAGDWELTALCLSDDLRGVEAEHHRLADALNVKNDRVDRLKSIAASQQSVKSGRIVAVLNGDA